MEQSVAPNFVEAFCGIKVWLRHRGVVVQSNLFKKHNQILTYKELTLGLFHQQEVCILHKDSSNDFCSMLMPNFFILGSISYRFRVGFFHRDSSFHLRPLPTPNFYATKSFSKVGHCALCRAPNFMKSTPKSYLKVGCLGFAPYAQLL